MTDTTTPASLQPAPIQQSPQDRASEAAIQSHITGASPENQEQLFNRSVVEHRRSAGASPDPDQWRDGSATLAPMPTAPTVPTSEVESAINKLNAIGGAHAALVQEWQTTGANAGEELAYAREAYKAVVANDPGLIEAVDRAGLGNHPAVLRFLSKQGRLDAGRLGDLTIARNNSNQPAPFTPAPFARTPAAPMGSSRGSEETRQELQRLIDQNGPGTERYKDPAIQGRIQHLHGILAGSGSSIVGRSGRTS
jgi:hypothetical protein